MDSRPTLIPFPQWRVPELYPHIGKVAVEWGFLDFGVTSVTAVLFSVPEIAQRQRVVPRALSRRLQMIGRSLRNTAALSQFRAEGEALIERVRRLTPLRDSVIHGYPGHYEVETGRIIFHGADIDDDQTGHDTQDTPATIQDLIGLGLALHALAADFARFGHRLFAAGIGDEQTTDSGSV